MQPYATASEPGPLNGNRPVVNGNNSFFTEYRTPILYSIALVVAALFIAVSVRGKYSWYDTGKVEKGKKSKKSKKSNEEPKSNEDEADEEDEDKPAYAPVSPEFHVTT